MVTLNQFRNDGCLAKGETHLERCKHLNSIIMNIATCGESDCTGPVVIYHNKIDRYVFVLVEEYTGDWHHRIFIDDGEFEYEPRYMLDPVVGMNPRYIYDCYWNIYSGKTELRHFEKGDWIDDVEAQVRAQMDDHIVYFLSEVSQIEQKRITDF